VPDLAFRVLGALQLEISNQVPKERIRGIQLHCQIHIETARRHYTDTERDRLRALFGEPELWRQSLRSMFWANITLEVPGFTGSTIVDLPIPCTERREYFDVLEPGDVPLILFFSGTVFYETPAGALQVAPIPWSSEARFLLPMEVRA